MDHDADADADVDAGADDVDEEVADREAPTMGGGSIMVICSTQPYLRLKFNFNATLRSVLQCRATHTTAVTDMCMVQIGGRLWMETINCFKFSSTA